MSDSLVKNSGTADSLLKDTVLSGLRELAADSAGHLPDSVRGKVAIPDSIGAAVTDFTSQTAYRLIRWRKIPPK